MAMVTIPGGIYLPRAPQGGGGNAQTSQVLVDADAEGAGNVIIAPRTGDIQEFAFATQSVTTTGDLDCRIETIGATDGLPTGTLWGTNTNVTKSVVDTDDNAWIQTGNLTANASVTKGVSKLAVIVQRPSGGAFVGNIKGLNSSWHAFNFPYGLAKTSASWTKGATTTPIFMAIKYSDGVWEPVFGLHSMQLMTSLTVSNATSPDEVGNVFQLPFKYRTSGCWVWVDAEATNSFTMALYDDSATAAYSAALTEVSVDSDQLMTPGSGYVVALPFEDAIEVAANTVRRLVLRPTSGTSMTTYRKDFSSSTFLNLIDGGDDIYYTSRANDGGTFSDDTAKRLLCGLIIDQVDDGAGGGGGGGLLRNPGMQGGLAA